MSMVDRDTWLLVANDHKLLCLLFAFNASTSHILLIISSSYTSSKSEDSETELRRVVLANYSIIQTLRVFQVQRGLDNRGSTVNCIVGVTPVANYIYRIAGNFHSLPWPGIIFVVAYIPVKVNISILVGRFVV